MKRIYLQIFFLLLLAGCSNTSAPSKGPLSLSSQQRKIQAIAYQSSLGHHSGSLDLSYRQLSLAEIAAHLEMDEETAKAHLKATNVHGYFYLVANNYPAGVEFILYQIDMEGKMNPTKSFTVADNGILYTRLDDLYIDLANNFLFFSRYLPGEPVDFVLASKDGRYHAATRIVPNPIQATDYKKRRLTLEISSKEERKYLVRCTNLMPHGSYLLTTRFENERMVYTVEANEKGEIYQEAGPTLPWVAGGDGFIELKGDGVDRTISLDFTWEV